jgi:hypothetical protein
VNGVEATMARLERGLSALSESKNIDGQSSGAGGDHDLSSLLAAGTSEAEIDRLWAVRHHRPIGV